MNNLKSKFQVFNDMEEIIRQEMKVNEYEDSFVIFNLREILDQHKKWLLKMPRVKPYYAIKCNPNTIMIEILSAMDVNFDCASKGEIEQVLSANVKPDRIIYANPCKTRSHIKYAKSREVKLMTFDCETELKKIAEIFPESRLVLRIKVDDTCSAFQLGSKFGASIEESFNLLHLAKKLTLNVVGISFHAGSDCKSAFAFEKAIEDAKCVFDYGLKIGFKMHLLDIGGGFTGESKLSDLFDETANVISDTLSREFPINYVENLEIIAEPGRYYATSAFTVVTQITSKKIYNYNDEEIRKNSESAIKDALTIFKPNLFYEQSQFDDQQILENIDKKRRAVYYLNDGIFTSFNLALFDNFKVYLQPYYLKNDENIIRMSNMSNYMSTILFGHTCDSTDVIVKNIYLPEMEIGDFIIFRDMGAYSICLASKFNGFEPPKIRYYLDNYTINILKTLNCWTRVKNLIIKVNNEDQE